MKEEIKTSQNITIAVPLENYKLKFCYQCSDKEWCHTDKLNRLECILCALLFILNDKRR